MTKQQFLTQPKDLVFKTFAGFFAFGFGSGLSPFAPGTFGTLASIPLYLLLIQLSWPMYAWLVLIAFVVGIKLCDVTGGRLGVHDYGGIVWDEFVGYWITMFLITFTWQNVLMGFFVFRFFDIVKPYPIAWLDKKVSGGFGVMIDDVLAGVYAMLVMLLVDRYLPNYF
ncbi:MAG TPA: phosphatidylglycerophosphatase A [Oceanospirillales bacterium]|nr:phosphatidylglycerophosphatase A [Oceanospirillales bacterium]